ncbi:MAG TPA: fluoride efflux transporter CrcB [Polyangia bacterium]|jgi:CrcB protein
MARFLWICLGGAAGTGARYLLTVWTAAALGTRFPYGTLAVNLIGSFLIGVIMQVGLTTEVLSPTTRMALTTGIMGGFTTYSTFSYETVRYLQQGAWGLGALNILVTTAGCLIACVLGLAAGRWALSP